MTCQCRAEWCWVCGKGWRGHTPCRTVVAAVPAAGPPPRDPFAGVSPWARRHIERSDAHLAGLRAAASDDAVFRWVLYEAVGSVHGVDELLYRAAETVARCRAVLRCGFIFAFYLAASPNQAIFADNLHDLDTRVGELIALLEPDDVVDAVTANPTGAVGVAARLNDLEVYCRRRVELVLQHYAEVRATGAWRVALSRGAADPGPGAWDTWDGAAEPGGDWGAVDEWADPELQWALEQSALAFAV